MKHSMLKCGLNFFCLKIDMLKPFFALIALVFYVALVGCGTRGPLYIPEQRYPQKTQDEEAQAPGTVPAEQNKEQQPTSNAN